MRYIRMSLIALLLFLGPSVSSITQDQANKNEAASQDQSPNQCLSTNPFGYDHSSSGQVAWCGKCNSGSRQAPINIPSNTPESSLPAIEFVGYREPTNLIIYNNPYNLKVENKNPLNMIRIAGVEFKLGEFHFHRPSEEAIDNHRFPMVAHLVYKKDGCEAGDAGCVAVITILIEQGTPAQKTSDLLKILFQHFPPPIGEQKGVQIMLDGLLPPKPENKSSYRYYRYDGSLTTPPCTENLTFYLLKPPLKFSAEQIAEFERHYPSPNARDIQPLNGRKIENRY